VNQVRWAVAGYGAGGRVFHAPLIRDADGIDLVAAVSTNPRRAEDARTDGLAAVDDLSALTELGVEGVTITTPAGTHADLAHEALELGLHVVVDKPFAPTADQAQSIVDHAAQAGLMLSVYQNRRWDGDFLTVRDALEEIGPVRRFVSTIQRFRPELPAWTRDRPSADGGGVLIDLGSHLIDQAVHLLGPAVSVTAELAILGTDRVAEDDAIILIEHAGGARSTVVPSVHSVGDSPRFQVTTERGGVVIDGFDVQEEQLFDGGSPASLGDDWGLEPVDRTARVLRDGVWSEQPLRRGEWTAYYPAIVRAIRDGAPVPVDPLDAVHVAAIFDAARTSSAEERTVRVNDS